MFDDPPGKPQTVGDLIGRSFRLYRRQIGLLFRTLIGPTIFAAIGALGLQFFIYRAIDNSMEPVYMPYVACAGSLMVLLVANLVSTLRQLAFVRMTAGFDNNYATAQQVVSRQKWQLLALFVIGFGASVLFTIFWVVVIVVAAILTKAGSLAMVAGVAAMFATPFGLLVGTNTFVVVGFLAICVLACEKQGIGTVINRALGLTFGDFWRTLGFGLLLYTVIYAISIPLTLPVIVASGIDVYQHGITSANERELYEMPLYLMVLTQSYQSLVNMLLWPVSFMAFGLFYHDLRLRQEGLDIRRQLETLERSAS